jgi:hypothetical protein
MTTWLLLIASGVVLTTLGAIGLRRAGRKLDDLLRKWGRR